MLISFTLSDAEWKKCSRGLSTLRCSWQWVSVLWAPSHLPQTYTHRKRRPGQLTQIWEESRTSPNFPLEIKAHPGKRRLETLRQCTAQSWEYKRLKNAVKSSHINRSSLATSWTDQPSLLPKMAFPKTPPSFMGDKEQSIFSNPTNSYLNLGFAVIRCGLKKFI